MKEVVRLQDSTVEVCLSLDDQEIVEWLRAQGDDAQRVEAAKRALKVGVVALGSALISGTSRTLREALEKWRTEIEDALKKSHSQVVQAIMEDVERRVGTIPDEVRKKITEHLDAEFNPDREGSYLWKVREKVEEYFNRRLGTRQAEGIYEERAVGALLQSLLSQPDTLESVGTIGGVGGGKEGDWLITVNYGSLTKHQPIGRIVVEVRDREMKKSAAVESLKKALKDRNAQVGILAFIESDQNPYRSPFAIVDGDYTKMVCLASELGLAYHLARLYIVEQHLRSAAESDWAELSQGIEKIWNQVDNLDKLINTLSEAQKSAKQIQEALLENIKAVQKIISRRAGSSVAGD